MVSASSKQLCVSAAWALGGRRVVVLSHTRFFTSLVLLS